MSEALEAKIKLILDHSGTYVWFHFPDPAQGAQAARSNDILSGNESVRVGEAVDVLTRLYSTLNTTEQSEFVDHLCEWAHADNAAIIVNVLVEIGQLNAVDRMRNSGPARRRVLQSPDGRMLLALREKVRHHPQLFSDEGLSLREVQAKKGYRHEHHGQLQHTDLLKSVQRVRYLRLRNEVLATA